MAGGRADEALASGDLSGADDLLRRAERRWRGPVLSGVPLGPVLSARRTTAIEQRAGDTGQPPVRAGAGVGRYGWTPGTARSRRGASALGAGVGDLSAHGRTRALRGRASPRQAPRSCQVNRRSWVGGTSSIADRGSFPL
ncbi:BTAD domain-containing putative transcriptional regulator [Plantactinospora sp. CA-294935]|uniref:BTAD domain-containing putative transcriptional regulator n=1 Tax=Plantactinospora sp. CA-294935 TaxID=3240012 RepID=UPI003D8DFCA9